MYESKVPTAHYTTGCVQKESDLLEEFGYRALKSISHEEFIMFSNEIRARLKLPMISPTSTFDIVTYCRYMVTLHHINIPSIYYAIMVEIYFDYWL